MGLESWNGLEPDELPMISGVAASIASRTRCRLTRRRFDCTCSRRAVLVSDSLEAARDTSRKVSLGEGFADSMHEVELTFVQRGETVAAGILRLKQVASFGICAPRSLAWESAKFRPAPLRQSGFLNKEPSPAAP
jgi:hypothetical protein